MEWEICKNFRRDRHWHWSSSFPVDSPMLGMVADYRHRFYFDRHPYVSFLLMKLYQARGKGGTDENLLRKTAAFFTEFNSNALQEIKIKYGCTQPYFIFRNRNMN